MTEAINILELVKKNYGGFTNFQELTAGERLNAEQSLNYFKYYLDIHELSNVCSIKLVESQASATSIKVINSSSVELRIRLPLAYSMYTLQGAANHELGTHLIRSINDKQQVWHSKRKKYKLKNHVVTEEGLACLNTYISTPSKLLARAALHYYSACLAYFKSFGQLFEALKPYVADPELRWIECLRVKRGITTPDGCFSKDQAYFRGAVNILRNRHSINFKLLYCGKISVEELEMVEPIAKLDNVKLPCFMQDMDKYIGQLGEIAKINNLDV